jgi:hypothetical protein
MSSEMDPNTFSQHLISALKNPSVVKELTALIESCFQVKILELEAKLEEKEFVLNDLAEKVEVKDIALKKLTEIVEEKDNALKMLSKKDEEKENVIKQLSVKETSLEDEVDSLEQYSRRNSLRVSNLPEGEHENPVERALELFNVKMNVAPPIVLTDLDRVHRVGKKDSTNPKHRALLIKFATYRARNAVFSKRSELFDSGKPRNEAIYVNEDVTPKRAKQLYELRKLKKANKIKDAWTHDGNIVIKDMQDKIKPIRQQQVNELIRSLTSV